MNALRKASLIAVLFLLAAPLMAATKYGDAVIERGQMTVIREGRSLKFDEVNRPIEIVENDLIRVRNESRVILNSKEKAKITLGANAVFHVKPWRSKGKTGFVRALFGRFRASVTGLFGGNQFNVKTASATIGVKGTDYITQVTNRAGTLLIVRDDTVGFQGQQGPEVDVNQGRISLIINFNPPTPPVPVPPAVGNAFGAGKLDAPPPNSPAAGNFAGEKGLVQAGLVTQGQLDEGKGEGQPFTEDGFDPPGVNFDPNEASESLQRGKVRLQFN